MSETRSILVIRRDNIGDLVCTTPLLSALRATYPDAWLGVLANSYNAPALEGNPDIDQVFAYRKLKHLDPGQSTYAALAGRVSMLWTLRRKRLDLVIPAAGMQDRRGARLAALLAPARIVCPDPPEPGQHEVERTFSAARRLGITGEIPPLRVTASAAGRASGRALLERAGLASVHPLLGVHISARRPAQRWPAARFAELIVAAHDAFGAASFLFWSPGADGDARHPGDDGKARAIADAVGDRAPLLACPTEKLGDLIGGLSLCDKVICSDGGAMHLAAGLGKSIMCFFGDSPAPRWRPWGVRHVVLQPRSANVADVSVQVALGGLESLLGAGS